MVRRADELFLAISVKNNLMDRNMAKSILDELRALDARGKPRKARKVCIERGVMSSDIAKRVKQLVMEQLTIEAQQARSQEKNDTSGKIGPYQLSEIVYKGPGGRLYKAQHKNTPAPLFLKALDENGVPANARRGFLKNVKLAARVNNANIARVVDAGEDKEFVYIAYPAASGVSLAQKIKDGHRFDEGEAGRVIMALAEGLRRGEAEGVLHGYITPNNIIYEQSAPILYELGAIPPGLILRSDDNTVWRAPEVLQGAPLDIRSDIYSLGAAMYFAITGRRAYDNGQAAAQGPQPLLAEANAGVSSGFARMIDTMMSRDINKRYQSYSALIGDLDNVVAGFAPSLSIGQYQSKLSVASKPDSKSKKTGSSKRSPTQGNEDRPGKPRRRSTRGGDEEEAAPVANHMPVIALGGAAVVFLAAVVIFGSGSGKTNAPVDLNNNNNPTVVKTDEYSAEKALIATALAEYQSATQMNGWPKVVALERVANDYSATKYGKKARDEAESLRAKLERKEAALIKKNKFKLAGLKAENRIYDMCQLLKLLQDQISSPELSKKLSTQYNTLETQRTTTLTATDAQVKKYVLAKNYGAAISALDSSLGLRDPKSSQIVRNQIADLTKKVESIKAAETAKIVAANTKLVEGYESQIFKWGQAGEFKLMLAQANLLLPKVKSKLLVQRLNNHIKASKILQTLDDVVCASALDMINQTIEVKRVRDLSSFDAQLLDVKDDGSLEFKFSGGAITIQAADLSLQTKEDILREQDSPDAEGLTALGLTMIYQGRMLDGKKRLGKAQKKGNQNAFYFLNRWEYYAKLYNKYKPTPIRPDDVVVAKPKQDDPRNKPDKNDPKRPKRDPDDETIPNIAHMIGENWSKLFISTTKKNLASDGRVGIFYNFIGTQTPNAVDWNVDASRNAMFPSPTRQSLVLQKSGSVFHKAIFKQEFQIRIVFRYEGTLNPKRSKLVLVIEDLKKRERIETVFGQQVFHKARSGRTKKWNGQQRLNLGNILRPKIQQELILHYKEGIVTATLGSQLPVQIDGLGISKARLGFYWSNMSIDLNAVQVDGYLNDKWAFDQIEAANNRGKGKKRR